MNPSNAFATALAEERTAAHSQLLGAGSDAERREALDRLADLDDIAARSLDRVLVPSR